MKIIPYSPTKHIVVASLLSMLSFILLPGHMCLAQKQTQHKDARAEAVRAGMLRAFGGKKKLKALDYITYRLTRTAYRDEDTTTTEQLWFMHLRKPLVIKLEVNGQDTIVSSTASLVLDCAPDIPERKAAYERLLRSRFFNFLYLLNAPDADISFITRQTYKREPVNIIRVSNRQFPTITLDLFVNRKGEVVTSSTIDRISGQYERFGDEYAYEKLAGGVVFPLLYRVVQQDKLLAEGIFSNMQLNSLSPFWERQLRLLAVTP